MTGLKELLDAAMELGEPKLPPGGDIPYVVIPEGAALRDLELLLPKPARVRAAVVMSDLTSFCRYVDDYKDDQTAIFADPDTLQLHAIIDYHDNGAEGAQWCSHNVVYAAPRSPEWKVWRSFSGKVMAQADFALFIEDNLADITNPPGAEILELARGLKAKKEVEFVSTVDRVSGSSQLTYNETIQGQQARGNMEMPSDFNLGIPVFFGGERYAVVARVRYRIEGGKLRLWYDLYRPEYIERDAFNDVIAKVKELTEITPWLGKN